MSLTPLTAISPLDGRYNSQTHQLRAIVSEYGLIFYRLRIEIDWLIALGDCTEFSALTPFTTEEKAWLRDLENHFNSTEAEKIKAIEKTTNHDVKAVEYYLREKCESHKTLKRASAFIHFGCTSEDINNLAYAFMIQSIRDTVIKPALEKIINKLRNFATETADISMLSHTHGQPATPTTIGKELMNVVKRLETHVHYWLSIPISGKCNGAVGNFNAHRIACPAVDWPLLSEQFVESFGFRFHSHTTQIEPHDFLAQWLNALTVCNTILIDLSRDCWGYIALNYFSQRKQDHEVGSSTMPHKVNPIQFENAEGNLGIAVALATHLSQKLPISRWQRDLSDSTVLRNIGVIAGHALIAYQALIKGISLLSPNNALLKKELEMHPEVLTEAIQTVMRYHGITDAYEQLKKYTRGKSLTIAQLHEFIEMLSLPAATKASLKTLTPESYIGYAATLASNENSR